MTWLDATASLAPPSAPYAGTTVGSLYELDDDMPQERANPKDPVGVTARDAGFAPALPASLQAAYDRRVLGATAAADRDALHAERRQLVDAELMGELTPAQARRLRMVRWQIDMLERQDFARDDVGLERLVRAHEATASRVTALVTELRAISKRKTPKH